MKSLKEVLHMFSLRDNNASQTSPSVGQRTPTPEAEQAIRRACSGVAPSSVNSSMGQSARRISKPLQRKMLGNHKSLILLVFSKSTDTESANTA